MVRWSRKAAYRRMEKCDVLQEAFQQEGMLRYYLLQYVAKVRPHEGYSRLFEYERWKSNLDMYVGFNAKKEALRTSEYYDAVMNALADLLPYDGSEGACTSDTSGNGRLYLKRLLEQEISLAGYRSVVVYRKAA